MNTNKATKFLTFVLAGIMCALSLVACSNQPPADNSVVDEQETKYLEAYDKLEKGEYVAAYELFVELGDYKDAAKEAAYFHYMPVGHHVVCTSEEGEEIVTYTVTLNDQNLPATVVEEYSTGYKHTCVYTYNERGVVTHQECTDTEGEKNVYEATFDANGNCLTETLTDKDGNVSKFDLTYNEKGQQIKVVTTNTPDYYRSYTIAYDDLGREIEVLFEFDDENIIERTTYNEAGDILQKTWEVEGGEVYSIDDYLYDEKGRLVEIRFTEDGEDGGYKKTTYNDKGQIHTVHAVYAYGYEYISTYEYDEHGNRIKEIYATPSSEECDDVIESTYQFVYVPFEYTEDDWEEIFDTTQCMDPSHM